MAYRESAREEAPKGTFWYGPFPITGPLAGSVAAFLILAPLAIFVATQKQTLDCDRQTGTCAYHSTNRVGEGRHTSFPIADVTEIRYVQGSGKSKSSAEVVIVFRSGRDLRLPSEPEDEARARKERMQSYFAGSDLHQLHEGHEPGLAARLLIVALALSSGAFALAWLGKVLPFRVHVFRDRIRIPRTKKSFDVNAATKVAVEVHPENDKLRRVAVLSGRDVDFLVHEGRAGAAAHQRAAQKLGQLLELPVDLGPDRVETPWKLPTLPRSIPRRWKIILGLFLFATTASGIVGLYASRTQGTIEIDCQGRCRFENMECLPGGSVAMSAEPGTFRIETWAPDSAEHWKPNDVQIRAGATTKFVCPATR